MSIRILNLHGNAYERGYRSGLAFKRSLSERSRKYRQITTDLKESVKNVINKTRHIFPEYITEVIGRADGAGISRDIYFAMMCPELMQENTGCTTCVARKADGNIILSHNEDDNCSADDISLVKINRSDGWFVTNDVNKMPFGNGFSWNSYGIVKTINYTHSSSSHLNLSGIPRYFTQRHVSEATSIEDFIIRCNHPDRASGFHAIVCDAYKKKSVSIEVTAKDISVKDIDAYYCHANHYIHRDIHKGTIVADRDGNSLFRQEKVQADLKNLVCIDSFRQLRDIIGQQGDRFENSILISKAMDESYTWANFSYDTSDQMVHLRFYFGGMTELQMHYDIFPDEGGIKGC